jgi:hypothetical protein
MENFKFTICLFLLFTLFDSSQCSKNTIRDEKVDFDFLIPYTVSPLKDTIRLGEELTIATVFSDTVYDIKSGKWYHLPDFDWKPLLFFSKLVAPDKPLGNQSSAGNQFEYINILGGFTNVDNIGANMKYVYKNGQYKLIVKIKTKGAGVYCIEFVNDFSPRRIQLPTSFTTNNTPGVNRRPVIGFMRNYVNNGQNNYQLLKQNCLIEESNIDSISVWQYKNRIYTFVVKE